MDQIDPVAQKFKPGDAPSDMEPIETYGDGNCFPRAIAHAAFGTQSRHEEIRVRIIDIAVKKEHLFLNNDYLSRGLPAEAHKVDRPSMYCLYSGEDHAISLHPNQEDIRLIYHRDIMRLAKKGGWMGVWQFHQSAEMLGVPIGSIYPQQTNPRIRSDMNRMMLPTNNSFHNRIPIYVMWTPLIEKTKGCNVKHFVVLLR